MVTSLFDILNYPDFHSSVCTGFLSDVQVTTKLALYGCIALFIDVVCSKLYLKSTWEKQKWRKIIYMICSWIFALAFGLLYYVKDCPGWVWFLISHVQPKSSRWISASPSRRRITAS